MILNVPYVYEVEGYAPHRRTPETDHRLGRVEVLVEDVPEAEAPVALAWNRSETLEHRDGRKEILIRAFGDGLWVPASQAGKVPGLAPRATPDGDLAGAVASGAGPGNPFARFLRGRKVEDRPDRAFRRELGSNRDAVEAEVRSLATRMVVVGGVLHVPCPEPVLVRGVPRHDTFLLELKVDWFDAEAYAAQNPADVYRPDEWPTLLADARRFAAELGMEDSFDLPDELDWIEARMPWTLSLPTEAAALSHAVACLHQEMGGVIRDCTEAGAGQTLRRRGGKGGRDNLAWSAPYETDIPDPRLMEAYCALGGLLAAGLDEEGLERVRELMESHGADHAGWRDDDDHRRWKYARVTETWGTVAAAFRRWDARPAHLRAAAPERDHADEAALAAVGP